MTNNIEIGVKLIKGEKLERKEVDYLRKYWQGTDTVINWDRLSNEQLLALDPKKLTKGQRSYLTSLVGHLRV